jgi:hypothetical protein
MIFEIVSGGISDLINCKVEKLKLKLEKLIGI